MHVITIVALILGAAGVVSSMVAGQKRDVLVPVRIKRKRPKSDIKRKRL